MQVKSVALLLSALIPVTGCATGTWKNMPPARPSVLAYYIPEDPVARPAAAIARTLSTARPLPVDFVVVVSGGYLNRRFGASFADDNAGAWRCGPGNPPASGCIYLGDWLLARLSREALTGVLAHELGHLEKGHRPTGELATALRVSEGFSDAVCRYQPTRAEDALAAAIACGVAVLGGTVWAAGAAHASQSKEHEADQAAIERLAAAGHCAGAIMRTTFAELATLAPARGSGGLLASHPGYRERWERAGTDCGPVVARRSADAPLPDETPQPTRAAGGWHVIAVEAVGRGRYVGGPYEYEDSCRAAQAGLAGAAEGARLLCVSGHVPKWQLVLVKPPASFKSAHWQFTSEEHCGSAARTSFPGYRFRCERLE